MYVVECALKALWLHEHGVPPEGQKPAWKAGKSGHEISELQKDVATLSVMAGAKVARYVGTALGSLPTAQIAAWNPTMRYRSPSMTIADATAWVKEAQSVYDETLGQMLKDGVL